MTQQTKSTATGESKVQQAKATAKEKTEPIREKTGKYVEETKTVIDRAGERAKSTVAQQKDVAANQLHDVAEALRYTSDQPRQQEQGNFARYSNEIADQIDRASGYLEEHSLDDLRRDAADFARQQPELFIGGAFTLGLFAVRFMKSSAPDSYRRSASQEAVRRTATPSHTFGGDGSTPSQRPSSSTTGQRTRHQMEGDHS